MHVYVTFSDLTAGILQLTDAQLISPTNIAMSTPTRSFSSKGGAYQDTVNFDITTITNTPDNKNDANDVLVVELTGLVVLDSVNSNISINIRSNFTYSNSTMVFAEDQRIYSLFVIVPALEFSYTMNPINADAGDYITGTLVISHAANSTCAAYNVTLTAQVIFFIPFSFNTNIYLLFFFFFAIKRLVQTTF